MKLFKISLLWLVAILVYSCGSEKKTEDKDQKENKEESTIEYNYGKTDSLLWKITGNGLETPSYLFGTVHMIPKDDFFISKEMQESFNECDQLVLEIDMEEINMFDLSILEKMKMPDSLTIADFISEEDFTYLKNFFKDTLNMSLEMIDGARMKPIFLSSIITESGGKGDTESYELTLTSWAKMEEMEINGLETLDFQMAVFDSIPYGKQAEMLMEGIKNYEKSKDELKDLYKYYKSNELSKLMSLSDSSSSDLMEFEEIILIKRNTNWIPKIAEMAAKKPTFFAVGALHLPGENGVVELLRKEGFEVEPLK